MTPTTKHFLRFMAFLVINFGALGLGGYLMGEGPTGEWYRSLAQAPWTPPGWVFGAAWTSIMILFSIYVNKIYQRTSRKGLFWVIYTVQLVLNVSWNPLFFMYHKTGLSLFVIVSLLLLLILMAMHFSFTVRRYTWLIMPYIIWLFIATSLNAYITVFN